MCAFAAEVRAAAAAAAATTTTTTVVAGTSPTVRSVLLQPETDKEKRKLVCAQHHPPKPACFLT